MKDVLKFFNGYPSVKRIRKNIKTNENFTFQQVTEALGRKIVLNLDSFKPTSVADVFEDMLKSTVDIRHPFMTKIITSFFENNCFPDDQKLVEVSSVFKKKDDLTKQSYRTVRVFSHVSKVFKGSCAIKFIIS